MSNFCQDLGEARELTMNAQHVASALNVCSAHAERIQRTHAKKSNECTVLLACGTNGPRKRRWTCIRSTPGVRYVCAKDALGVRYVCARCSLELS